jgi:glycosyltransferase involved in cell wall biosynthesis
MRALIVSHAAAHAANRGKLRALVGLGGTVTAAVPDRVLPGAGMKPSPVAWSDDGGVRVVPIAVRGALTEPAFLHWNAGALRRLAAELRPDVVQLEEQPGSPAAATVAALARRAGLPLVVVATESVARPYTVGERLRRSRVLRSARGVIGINRLALGLALRQRPEVPNVVVPQHGVVPPPAPSHREHEGFAVGFVGRLVPERGLDILFRAAVRLPGRWSITVAGTGPAQEELEALAERLGIAARVRWLGGVPRRELAGVWPLLDCAVLPARTTPRWVEPVGSALLEAMGNGVAAVGSASGALPDVIGDAGVVVPEDDPAALADALARLADDPAARAALGSAGRRRVLDVFSESAVARDTLAFWRRVTAPLD